MKKPSAVVATIVHLLLLLPAFALAQEQLTKPGLHPYISVSEEYDDNINLTSANRKDDYITTITPGLRYSKQGPDAGINLDYNAGFVFYGKETGNNYISQTGSLDAKYLTREHVNFYFKDSFIRSEDNREYELFTTNAQNQFVLATQTNRSVYSRNVAAPTVEYQFGQENRIGLNYRNNVYRTDNVASENSQENYINPFADWWLDHRNGIHLEYGYTIGDFERSSNMRAHMGNVRYTNRITSKSSVFGEYTFTRRNFDDPVFDYDVHQPDIGITYAFSPTFTASAQVGYFWREPAVGSRMEGLSYKANVTNTDVRTTYIVSLQGGYNEDYFTSQNLGFNRYHRLTGSITHFPEKRISVSLAASVERVNYANEDRDDWITGITGILSYMPLKWLNLSLKYSHRELASNMDINEYTDNSVMVSMTATY